MLWYGMVSRIYDRRLFTDLLNGLINLNYPKLIRIKEASFGIAGWRNFSARQTSAMLVLSLYHGRGSSPAGCSLFNWVHHHRCSSATGSSGPFTGYLHIRPLVACLCLASLLSHWGGTASLASTTNVSHGTTPGSVAQWVTSPIGWQFGVGRLPTDSHFLEADNPRLAPRPSIFSTH